MQTALADFIRDTPAGQEADAILRSCVHCGFCLSSCPTYRLLGDELDSPRGRICVLQKDVIVRVARDPKAPYRSNRTSTAQFCAELCRLRPFTVSRF